MATPLDLIRPLSSPRTVTEADAALSPLVGVPFGTIFPAEAVRYFGETNKGAAGRGIESLLGLKVSSAPLDFMPFAGYAGGELKTVSTTRHGLAKESVSVCSLGTQNLDELLAGVNFAGSYPGLKLREVLVVGICREGEPSGWHLTTVRAFLPGDPIYDGFYGRMSDDYRAISRNLTEQVDTEGLVRHGTPARGRMLQVRPKGAGHGKGAVWSDLLGGPGTDQGRGLFITRGGLREMLAA